MKTNTLSGLPQDLVMQIMFFLSSPTLIQLLSKSFHNQSKQDYYWQRLICKRFSTFATLNQLAEDKAPTLKNIYYLLSLFTKPSTPQALMQIELDTFLAPDPQQTINRFPWACYIQGFLLLSKKDSDKQRAYPLFKNAIENKFPGSSARRMMAFGYRKTILDPDQQYQLLLESAFKVEKHSATASELGRFFEFQLKNTNDKNLKDSFWQSAIEWREKAFDLLKDEDLSEIDQIIMDEKIQNYNAIIDLHVPGSEGLLNFLSKHGEYNAIFLRYEDFIKNKVITSSKKELHESWLNEMRETKDVTSKQLYAKELLKMYQTYLADPTHRSIFDWLNDSQIKALEKECCVILGRLTEEERRAEFYKNRIFQQPSGSQASSNPSDSTCLIM